MHGQVGNLTLDETGIAVFQHSLPFLYKNYTAFRPRKPIDMGWHPPVQS